MLMASADYCWIWRVIAVGFNQYSVVKWCIQINHFSINVREFLDKLLTILFQNHESSKTLVRSQAVKHERTLFSVSALYMIGMTFPILASEKKCVY